MSDCSMHWTGIHVGLLHFISCSRKCPTVLFHQIVNGIHTCAFYFIRYTFLAVVPQELFGGMHF